MTAAAWADYMERNRRARVIYDWLPIATAVSTPTPCHDCAQPTKARGGICTSCKERT